MVNSSEFVDKHYYLDKRGRGPSRRIWQEHVTPFEKLLYVFYVLPLIPILLILTLFCSLPYLFIRSTRPLLPESYLVDPKYGEDKYRSEFSYHAKKQRTDLDYEWFGETKEFPLYTFLVPLGRGPGLHRRTWEMFNFILEVYQMFVKQGLQVGGCLSAVIIGYAQVRMMVHDLGDDLIVGYSQTVELKNFDPAERLRSDKDCAYGVGLGIANWGSGKEPLAWYAMYHIFILILCICLFGDELLNVRFGCFAPQWFRAGNGYTMMFLATATLTTSPNWDFPKTLQFRYFILVIIFIFGFYNVFRTLVTQIGCSTSAYKHTDYRVGREPLRFWSESEWNEDYFRRNFIPSGWERHFWTEKLQAKVGDWNFPLQRRTRKEMKAELEQKRKEFGPKYEEGRIQKVYKREEDELLLQKGRMSRVVVHGAPKKMHSDFKKELKEMRRVHVGPIDPENLPTDEQEAKMVEDLDRDAAYFGIADWRPRTKSFGWWWFDVRRIYVMICAFALFWLRIGMVCFDLASSTFYQYLEEYINAQSTWKSNGGPDNSTCQYYKGSSVPIFVLSSGNAYSGVIAMYIWVGVWHTFLLGMCLAIFMVALSNNMWYGMHIGMIPMTLIGPRMTSMSMGITLGFVAIATLQQGFWFHNDAGIIFTKIICYASMVGFALSLFPNEPLRPNFTRDPFWGWTSRFAFRRMDRKKWHYKSYREVEDLDE